MRASLARETLSALGHLHSVGIVYRDLKPDNVLVRSDGHTVIADFGISKRLREGADAETQEANSMVGTPGFIAPEVLRSHFAPPDQRPGYKFEPDFWAYGVLLHLMLSGDEPTTSGSVVAALHMPTEQQAQSTTSTLSPTLAGDARDLIAALLVYEPTERLGSKGGAPVVQAHPFFSPIDWQRLKSGAAAAVFRRGPRENEGPGEMMRELSRRRQERKAGFTLPKCSFQALRAAHHASSLRRSARCARLCARRLCSGQIDERVAGDGARAAWPRAVKLPGAAC